MSTYRIEFDNGWDDHFSRLDFGMQKRIGKKIAQLQLEIPARHLAQGLHFYVSEIGQYRMCYTIDEKNRVKKLYFVGDHKEYEKWLGI